MTTELSTDSSSVHVVARNHLPSEPPPRPGHADEKSFHGSDLIRQLLPDRASVSMSWIGARCGEAVSLRSRSTPTLLLVLGGAARLNGELTRTVHEGDVVAVPVGRQYGFSDVSETGLEVLEIGFTDAPAVPRTAGTLAELLARNEALAIEAENTAFFRLLRDGTLDDPKKRARFFDCLQVFSDAFQSILVAREAMCRDERFVEVFSAHLRDELDHNKILSRDRTPRPVNDPVLKATVSWFSRQMFVFDNAEKAVLVHLVLETAGHRFHTLAKEVFKGTSAGALYFDAHSDADDKHCSLAHGVLEGLSPSRYGRLSDVLESSWRMFQAMGDRIARIVAAEGAS